MAKGIVADQGKRLIKKITHITKSLTGDADVDSLGFTVDLAKTIIANVTTINKTTNSNEKQAVSVYFNANNSVLYQRSSATGTTIVEFDIIEYENVKAVYTGQAIAFTESVTDAIGGSVNVEKSMMTFSWAAPQTSTYNLTGKLVDVGGFATNIQFEGFPSISYDRARWFVVEFY